MGETPDPPHVHAYAAASDAGQSAGLSNNRMERLLECLERQGILSPGMKQWIWNAPR